MLTVGCLLVERPPAPHRAQAASAMSEEPGPSGAETVNARNANQAVSLGLEGCRWMAHRVPRDGCRRRPPLLLRPPAERPLCVCFTQVLKHFWDLASLDQVCILAFTVGGRSCEPQRTGGGSQGAPPSLRHRLPACSPARWLLHAALGYELSVRAIRMFIVVILISYKCRALMKHLGDTATSASGKCGCRTHPACVHLLEGHFY